MTSKLTLVSLESYLRSKDDSLFKYLQVPDDTLDREVLIDSILLRGGEFEVLYSDPYFFQNMIGIWSNKWQRTMKRWYEALNQNYSPIENYDRYEDWAENTAGTSKDTSTGTGNTSSENKRSAYDSSTYENDNKNESNSKTTTSGQSELTNELKHIGHLHGNIGVTTAAQMIQGEIDIYSSNIYDLVADIFLSEFILPIY